MLILELLLVSPGSELALSDELAEDGEDAALLWGTSALDSLEAALEASLALEDDGDVSGMLLIEALAAEAELSEMELELEGELVVTAELLDTLELVTGGGVSLPEPQAASNPQSSIIHQERACTFAISFPSAGLGPSIY